MALQSSLWSEQVSLILTIALTVCCRPQTPAATVFTVRPHAGAPAHSAPAWAQQPWPPAGPPHFTNPAMTAPALCPQSCWVGPSWIYRHFCIWDRAGGGDTGLDGSPVPMQQALLLQLVTTVQRAGSHLQVATMGQSKSFPDTTQGTSLSSPPAEMPGAHLVSLQRKLLPNSQGLSKLHHVLVPSIYGCCLYILPVRQVPGVRPIPAFLTGSQCWVWRCTWALLEPEV